MREIKAVIDTNVFVRMLIGKGKTSRSLYQAFLKAEFTPVISEKIKEEILEVISRPRINKYFTSEETKRFKGLLEIDTITVIPTKKVSICGDPKDNIFIEAAIEAKAKYIVSNDKDILEIPTDKVSPIHPITPKEFLKILKYTK